MAVEAFLDGLAFLAEPVDVHYRWRPAADAPVGLRNAATMTSVSRTTLTSHIMSYRKFIAKLGKVFGEPHRPRHSTGMAGVPSR
jgi:hypothetical protein